jgi:hypothetical protein
MPFITERSQLEGTGANSGRIIAASSSGGIVSHHGWLLVIRALKHGKPREPVMAPIARRTFYEQTA